MALPPGTYAIPAIFNEQDVVRALEANRLTALRDSLATNHHAALTHFLEIVAERLASEGAIDPVLRKSGGNVL